MWRRRRSDGSVQRQSCQREESLADEVEAVVAGTYVEYLSARARPIPAWAYLNEVAHAPAAVLLTLVNARDAIERGKGPVGWLDAELAVVEEVVALADADPRTISTLQREVLVPLELMLAGRPAAVPLDPTQLVAVARAALYGHPSSGPQAQAA